MPEAVREGVRSLRLRPPPRLRQPDAWLGVIEDAERLLRDGWAEQALALGWSAHDLFGVGQRDSYEFSGLAVWLDGRRLALLDERGATVRDGANVDGFVRSGFGHGRDAEQPPVLLWEFGR